MNFCWVTITVKNMQESLDFYQNIIGLKIKRRMNPVAGTDIAFLGEEGTEVELIKNDRNVNPTYGRDISLGFEVESIDKEIERLKEEGIVNIEGPFQPHARIKFIYISDPNGVKVQLVENIEVR